jgi:hypothetical protein
LRSRRRNVEIYDGLTGDGRPGGRFLTVTGHILDDVPADICKRQEALERVYNRELKGQSAQKGQHVQEDGAVPAVRPTLQLFDPEQVEARIESQSLRVSGSQGHTSETGR